MLNVAAGPAGSSVGFRVVGSCCCPLTVGSLVSPRGVVVSRDDPVVRDGTDREAAGRRCTLVAVSSAGSFRGFSPRCWNFHRSSRCWKFPPTPWCWNFTTSRDAGGLAGVRDGSPRVAGSFAVSFCGPCRRCWKFCRTSRR